MVDGLRADTLSTAVSGGLLNGFPVSAFAQNVGLVAITGIKSRFVVAVSGVILVVLGLFPKVGAIVAAMPLPVLGGAGLALFGTVAASGIRALGGCSYEGNNNLIIVALSLAMGIIPIAMPDFYEEFPTWFQTIFDSGISAAAVTAVLLNILFNVGWGEGQRGGDLRGVADRRGHAGLRRSGRRRQGQRGGRGRHRRPGLDYRARVRRPARPRTPHAGGRPRRRARPPARSRVDAEAARSGAAAAVATRALRVDDTALDPFDRCPTTTSGRCPAAGTTRRRSTPPTPPLAHRPADGDLAKTVEGTAWARRVGARSRAWVADQR